MTEQVPISLYRAASTFFNAKNEKKKSTNLDFRDNLIYAVIVECLHHRNSKLFFDPTKFDNFKDEKFSDSNVVGMS